RNHRTFSRLCTKIGGKALWTQICACSVSHTGGHQVHSRDPCWTLPSRLGHHRILPPEHIRLGSRKGRLHGDSGNSPSDVHDLRSSVSSIAGEPCLDLQDHGTCSVREYDSCTVQVSAHW